MKYGRLPVLIAPLMVSYLAFATPAQASEQDWDTASTVTRDVLVLTAIGIPIAKGDKTGALEAGGDFARRNWADRREARAIPADGGAEARALPR